MNKQREKMPLDEKIIMFFLAILMCYGFTYSLEWHHKNNVLPTFTEEDTREMEFLKSLSLLESLQYYKRNIEINGFNFLKDESDLKAYELGGIKE
ncbi:MAG TPA: hypothetical protein EYG69_00195 [Campylobacterales bacterium]|nr:hypothetical protein [Campylobacterales bacterium]